MSADASASSYVPAQSPAREPTTVAPEPAVEAPSAVYWQGNPAALGLPCFIAGSVALGLAFVGVVPLTALGAAVPIVLTATSIGLFLATIWAAAVGQTAVASVFGIFVILAFAAVGVYLYYDCVSQATGGRALPLGRATLR
jgi:hypothetical protein